MANYDYFEDVPASELVRWAVEEYGQSLAICTSFQKSGMVILDMAARISTSIRVITLDTGRLPHATYEVMDTVRSHYGVQIEPLFPDPAELGAMVKRFGANLFYQSMSLRKLCCQIRKVRPLEKKLAEFRAWAVGLRRSQSEARAHVPKAEEVDGRLKLSPLADWSGAEVDLYIRRHGVPVHPLYARGYASIGCAPCTREVDAGENERAGRWWWEEEADKECGIHFTPSGGVVRGPDAPLYEILKATGSPHAEALSR